ncbi:MAG: hypothetical protein PHV51_08450 [Methanosarcinaceae archaeon]|nr:hypothetical protein [Methanosarcinaceae archaeon]
MAALMLGPKNLPVHRNYAKMLSSCGHHHAAEVRYKKALDLDTNNIRGLPVFK